MDELARRWGARYRALRNADVAEVDGLTLVKPRTYMNLSGAAVQAAMARGRSAGSLVTP